jgi:peptidoglycan/xylan/chitin deacetylase (PgdA/CDA1 family)
MYHRVATPRVDPWGLAVRPHNFAAQIDVLRRRRTPVTMSDFVERMTRGTLPANAVAVTFDDGYVDNLRQARPVLSAAAVPATLFVLTGAIGRTREFWWDEIARGILARESALDCTLTIAGESCAIAFGNASRADLDRDAWRAWQAPQTPRHSAYLDVWSRLRAAPASERDAAMQRIREALNDRPANPEDIPMNARELQEIAAGGLIEIGAHTVTHPVLTLLDAVGKRREIGESKRVCEQVAGARVSGFAYPHGAFDGDARAAVRDAGFAWACTTVHECVDGNRDPFALPRLFVEDCDAATFERSLQRASARAADADHSVPRAAGAAR